VAMRDTVPCTKRQIETIDAATKNITALTLSMLKAALPHYIRTQYEGSVAPIRSGRSVKFCFSFKHMKGIVVFENIDHDFTFPIKDQSLVATAFSNRLTAAILEDQKTRPFYEEDLHGPVGLPVPEQKAAEKKKVKKKKKKLCKICGVTDPKYPEWEGDCSHITGENDK
jgi:hypothetical protein